MSEALVRFLEFVKADLSESMRDYGDEFVRSLQKSVQANKSYQKRAEEFYTWKRPFSGEKGFFY